MPEKYKNKYRIKSARLPNWDYGSNGMYFITVCTKNRKHFFGNIINGKMQLNKIGEMANKYWHETPQHFPFVKLDAFVVMPNHIHGIIIIDKPNDGRNIGGDNENIGNNANVTHDVNIADDANVADDAYVETQNFASLPIPIPIPIPTPIPTPTQPKNKFGPQSKNLASIVRGYKIGVTKNARKIQADFAWQTRFYDHIIRNDKSFKNIKNYIINNPQKWETDKFYE